MNSNKTYLIVVCLFVLAFCVEKGKFRSLFWYQYTKHLLIVLPHAQNI